MESQEGDLVKEDDLFPGCSDMDEFLQAGYPIVMEGIRSSNGLPQGKHFGYLSTFPEFGRVMKSEGKRLQDVMQKIITYCGVKKQIAQQAATDKFDVVTDVNDKLLDQVVRNLSEMDGTRFNPNEDFGEPSKKVSGSWNKNSLAAAAAARERENEEIVQLVVQSRTVRPQVLFKDKIDNRNVPWVPKIKEKPNQLKPLALIVDFNEHGEEYYRNPYEYELDLWTPPESWLTTHENIQQPPGVARGSYDFVDTEEELGAVLEDLKTRDVFAVDLEAHSYRSYMGFVCLMQISTVDKDYLIDALKLRHKLHVLNDVFTHPKILKLFHGAVNDIEWLQRDFGIYVVGMFDTHTAAKALEYPKLGLAYLLKKFCNVDTNKAFQLFDWRIRPLPAKAVEYARGDTHYMIYIYRNMANELIEKGLNKTHLLEATFSNSRLTCQKVFMKQRWNENSHMSVYMRNKRHFDNRQLYALKEIFKWRDTVAREEDESTGYVLPNHMMMQICQTLPRELQGILACCNPIPPLVRQHALEIHQIILRAKDQPLVKSVTDVESQSAKSSQFSASRDVDLEIRLNTYVHDSANLEYRDDLPTLLDGTLPPLGEPPVVQPKLLLLVKPPETCGDDIKRLTEAVVKINFVPPYERYKKVLPYSIQEEKERQEKKRKAEEDRMQQSTDKQYASDRPAEATPKASTPKKRHVQEPPKPLAAGVGAQKKLKPNRRKSSSDDEDDLLPLVKMEKKIKHEVEEEDPASRIGVCGGILSLKDPPRQASYHDSPRNHQNRTPGSNRGRGRGNHHRAHNTPQPGDSDFKPFDYGAVNFDQFHSGSSRNMQLKSGDKKNGKKKNRQFRGRQFNKRGLSGGRGRR